MALLHIPLADVTVGDLDALIAGAAKESRYIDYKQQSYGGNEKALDEFRADISSFANTDGGDIVIGMKANGDMPTEICPLAGDVAAERTRLEQIARSGLQPQLQAVDVQSVSVPGGEVLIVRVGRSYVQPHRVVYKDGRKFWARGAAGKYEPDVEGLRAMFLRGPQLADRMRSIREDRIALLGAGRGPVPLMDQCFLVIHLVPFSSIEGGAALSITEVARHPQMFRPMGAVLGGDFRPNFDGLVTMSNAPADRGTHRAYVQLFRTGILEAVASSIRREGGNVVNLGEIGDMVISNVRVYASSLQQFGVNPPLGVMVSLVGVMGMTLKSNAPFRRRDGQLSDRPVMLFGDVVLNHLPANGQESAAGVRAIVEQLENAAGEIF